MKFCYFKRFLIILIWILFISLDMQHLFINVPKYVNHHMFIYVNILSELEKNKRLHIISGKGAATPADQTGCRKGQLTFQSRNKAEAYALVSDLLHTKLYIMGIIAHSSRIRPSYVYFKVAVVNVWQQMDSGSA